MYELHNSYHHHPHWNILLFLKKHVLLPNLSLRKIFCTSLICLWTSDRVIPPFYFLMLFTDRTLRSQIPMPISTNRNCVNNFMPMGEKKKSWFICASLTRTKDGLLLSPLQEDRLHSFTVLKVLDKGTTFKADSKPCCSCHYRSWLQSQNGALCCRITV